MKAKERDSKRDALDVSNKMSHKLFHPNFFYVFKIYIFLASNLMNNHIVCMNNK